MIDWLNNWLNGMTEMLGGPAHLRFVIQPLIALLLGIRDGRLDARAGTTPFIWNVLFEPEHRAASWRHALRAVWKPLVLATVIDAIVQHLVVRSVHLGYAVLTGCLLVGLPYAIVRGITNRVVTHRALGAHEPPTA